MFLSWSRQPHCLERYTQPLQLQAGRSYDLVMEIENPTPGAVKGQLYWRTLDLYAKEKVVEALDQRTWSLKPWIASVARTMP